MSITVFEVVPRGLGKIWVFSSPYHIPAILELSRNTPECLITYFQATLVVRARCPVFCDVEGEGCRISCRSPKSTAHLFCSEPASMHISSQSLVLKTYVVLICFMSRISSNSSNITRLFYPNERS